MESNQELWQRQATSDPDFEALLHPEVLNSRKAEEPLHKLQSALKASIVWGIAITVLYLAGGLLLDVWTARATFFIGTTFNVWILIVSYQLYRRLSQPVMERSLREVLQFHYDQYMSWWRVQERVGLFFYPLATVGGFLVGGMLASGKSAQELLGVRLVLMALAGAILVLVPVCFFTARWMFRYAYGRQLDRLRQLIAELEG